MPSAPSVTVTIPAYKQNDTLRKALRSIERQEYDGDIDVIVVDSSESGTAKQAVEEFPIATYHWQLTHVQRQETGMENLAVARDLGIAFAEGQYIHLLDHDDELKQGTIARKVDALEKYDGVEAAYTTIEKHDGTIGKIPPTVTGYELRFALTYLRSPALPSTLMVSRPVLEACPPRRSLPHEDICGLIEVLLRTDIGYIDEPLTVRNEPPNLSQSIASQRGRMETYERYSGLRSQLISEERQRDAREQYEVIQEKVEKLQSEHHSSACSN